VIARTFQYQALDATGEQRAGTIRAMDDADAYRKVAAAGLTPVDIVPERTRRSPFSFHRVRSADVVNLTRELAVLVEAKIPLDRGLASIAEHEKRQELVRMILDIAGMIEAGQRMTEALMSYRHIFGDVYIETIRAAEKSGNLQAVMSHLAEMLDRQIEMRQQVRRAMAYPIIVMSVVAVAVTIIVGFVVPKFAVTFAASGVKLPLATRIVQAVGDSFHSYWTAYAGVIAAIVFGVMAAWKHERGRMVLERGLLSVPYISRIIMSMTTARFARVLGIGLASGLDVIDSLEVAGRSTGRPVFARECAAMSERLRQGDRLVDVLHGTRYMPSFAKRMIGAGKDSKDLSKACDIVARHYDREASDLTKNVNTIVEPLLTVAMAGIVLLVALSVFLPMWQMARIQH
jgi:type II secretory pathway component PulF